MLTMVLALSLVMDQGKDCSVASYKVTSGILHVPVSSLRSPTGLGFKSWGTWVVLSLHICMQTMPWGDLFQNCRCADLGTQELRHVVQQQSEVLQFCSSKF